MTSELPIWHIVKLWTIFYLNHVETPRMWHWHFDAFWFVFSVFHSAISIRPSGCSLNSASRRATYKILSCKISLFHLPCLLQILWIRSLRRHSPPSAAKKRSPYHEPSLTWIWQTIYLLQKVCLSEYRFQNLTCACVLRCGILCLIKPLARCTNWRLSFGKHCQELRALVKRSFC